MILFSIDDFKDQRNYADEKGITYITIESGKPCEHKGCLSHQSHACEGCGRFGGLGWIFYYDMKIKEKSS